MTFDNRTLQRRVFYKTHKGRRNILNLLHNPVNRNRFTGLCSIVTSQRATFCRADVAVWPNDMTKAIK